MTVTQEITQKTDTGRAAVAPKYKLSVSRHFTPVCWCPGSVHCWWMAQMRARQGPWCRGGAAGWISGPLMDIIICKIFAPHLHCVHPWSLNLSAVSFKIPGPARPPAPAPVHYSCNCDPGPRRKQGLGLESLYLEQIILDETEKRHIRKEFFTLRKR